MAQRGCERLKDGRNYRPETENERPKVWTVVSKNV